MPKVLLCLLALPFLVGVPVAFAQEQPKSGGGLNQALMLGFAEGKPLAAISALESDPASDEVANQILATLYSFVGDVEKVKELQSVAQKKNLVAPPPAATYKPALDAIVEVARNRQIVMINESHDSPQHREFILELARRLREIGFDYYAMETLDEDPVALSQRGYPTLSTGFYIAEPVYGDLVRQALKLGYVPVAYEAPHDLTFADPIEGINSREQAQCFNLVKKVISQKPNAKLLIHVGFDHVMKSPVKAGDKQIHWLANRLKEATGIDPLSIDQTTGLSAETKWPQDHTRPVVVSDAESQFFVDGHFKGFVDVQVFHPPTTYRDGRPEWLFWSKERVVFQIPQDIEIAGGRFLIQARQVDESSNAVPIDQIIFESGKPRPVLALRPGNYHIVVQDNAANETSRKTITVVAPSGQ